MYTLRMLLLLTLALHASASGADEYNPVAREPRNESPTSSLRIIVKLRKPAAGTTLAKRAPARRQGRSVPS